MKNELIEKELEEFDRYKKEFEIESNPQNYIHIGLNASCQFSDFKSDIRQFAQKILGRVKEELKMEEKGHHSNSPYNPPEISDVIYKSKEDLIYNQAVQELNKKLEEL